MKQTHFLMNRRSRRSGTRHKGRDATNRLLLALVVVHSFGNGRQQGEISGKLKRWGLATCLPHIFKESTRAVQSLERAIAERKGLGTGILTMRKL